ncbi:MAG: radical SAM protein [Firmicutes bacterium]|nr:radical SAM protein [Candidatus Colimorpha enterica]
MSDLVASHFLVPEGYDDYGQTVRLRSIIRKLEDARRKPGIYTYTILPTTACNARCYYCFEQGVKTETMTDETADETVAFIKRNCNGKEVFLDWFGGEPTVGARIIDRICLGLQKEGVVYSSSITTNGFLFDEEMVDRAKNLWKLKSAGISLDGTAETYNKTKRYVTSDPNPFDRVLTNIGLLAKACIRVSARMNYDLANYTQFADLVAEFKKRFGDDPMIGLTVHPVNDEHKDADGNLLHGSEEWFDKKTLELNNLAREAGLYRRSYELPSLKTHECKGASPTAITITPSGNLLRCSECLGPEEFTGNLETGETDREKAESWRKVTDNGKCVDCVMFPDCMVLERCSGKRHCGFYDELIFRAQCAMEKEIKNKYKEI